MKIEVHHLFRFTLLVISGFLITGATGTWHAVGYLNPFAWAVEWLDIVFAFLCLYLATRTKDITNKPFIYVFIFVSASVALLPLITAARLPVLSTPDPIYYLVFLIPILFFLFLVYYSSRIRNSRKTASLLFFFSVLGTVMYVAYLFYSYSMRFPTDESVVDLYSAHLFLNGLNPYNHVNISGGFAYYGFPEYANTPLTTGGYVYYLTYPALSFILMMPSALLGIKGSLMMYPFFALPIFLVWYRGWSHKEWFNSVLVLLPFLSLSIYTSQIELSDLNIVWASLIMLSYYVLPKSKTSGLLYGLSLSVKQFPAITMPFLIYFIYREYGKRGAVTWLFTAVLAFSAVNGYFMVIGFHSFLTAMIANEADSLMGVGFGLSQLSFMGFLPIPPVYFSICMAALTLIFLTLYVAYYRDLKYALFVFPVLIFLFNYRLFIQYILYWLVLSLLPLMDLLHYKETANVESPPGENAGTRYLPEGSSGRKKAVSAVIIVILVASIAVGFNQGVVSSPGSFTIDSVVVNGYNATGYIDQMTVNLSFHGNTVNDTGVLFRFITPEPITNVNMYIWRPSSNMTIHSGENVSLRIVPLYSVDPLPSGTPYRLVAYYGGIMGFYSGTTSS